MTPIYKKVGRRYVEIGTHEDAYYHYPNGVHLVWSCPGAVLKKYNINPDDAALLAAAERMRDAMVHAMRSADRPTPSEELKGVQKEAWEAYKAIAGDSITLRLQGKSAYDVVDAGIQVALQAAQACKTKPLDPDMPSQEIRLAMGELTPDELLVARAAIRWANQAMGQT